MEFFWKELHRPQYLRLSLYFVKWEQAQWERAALTSTARPMRRMLSQKMLRLSTYPSPWTDGGLSSAAVRPSQVPLWGFHSRQPALRFSGMLSSSWWVSPRCHFSVVASLLDSAKQALSQGYYTAFCPEYRGSLSPEWVGKVSSSWDQR